MVGGEDRENGERMKINAYSEEIRGSVRRKMTRAREKDKKQRGQSREYRGKGGRQGR